MAVAMNSAATVSSAWQITGSIKEFFAGTVSLLGVPTVTLLGQDAGAAAWAVAAVADNTNKCLQFNVTGAAGVTINWVVTVQTAEVTS